MMQLQGAMEKQGVQEHDASNGPRPGIESSAQTKRSGDELIQAIAGMKALRDKIGRLTLEEILSARDEGRE